MDMTTTRTVILTVKNIEFLAISNQGASRVYEEHNKVRGILIGNDVEYDEDVDDNYVLVGYTIRADITNKSYEKIKDLIDKLSFLKKNQINITEEYTITTDRTVCFLEDTNV